MHTQPIAPAAQVREPRRRWEVTASSFDLLLAALDHDRDEAADKYLTLKKNLGRFFETRGIGDSDAASDEVLDRLCRKLSDGTRIEHLPSYALGIARLVALELCKLPREVGAEDVVLDTFIVDEDRSSVSEVREARLGCLDKCLSKLPAEKCEIIVGYYQGEKRDKIENRVRLAERLGIPAEALRSRATRLRDKLENCVVGCLKNG